MAERTQAAKRHKQSLKRKERNYAYRSHLRTVLKRARLAIKSDSDDKEERVAMICRELDRMVTKSVIHKNNAARCKSRLLNSLHGSKKPVMPAEPEPVKIPETGE